MSSLRLRYIEVFLALMQTGSTQGAAQVLHTTQPSISKALGALERQLGFPLFLRTGSGLKPTADAYALLAEADRVHEEILSFQRVAGELKEGRAVPLNLQVSPALAASIVPRAVALYKHRWQDAQLNIAVGRTDAIISSVRKQMADVGIVICTAEEDIGPVHHVWSSPMVCIVPRGHPLAARRVLGPADLAGQPLIAYRSSLGFGRLVERVFQEAGVEQRVEVRVNYTSAICAIVNAGYGVAVVDRLTLAEGAYPNVERRPFTPECLMNVGLLVSDQRPLSVQAERFIEALKQCLNELKA